LKASKATGFFVEEGKAIPSYDELIYLSPTRTRWEQRPHRPLLAATQKATQYIVKHPQDSWKVFAATSTELDDTLERRSWEPTRIPRLWPLRPAAFDRRATRYAAVSKRFLAEAGLVPDQTPVSGSAIDVTRAMTAPDYGQTFALWRGGALGAVARLYPPRLCRRGTGRRGRCACGVPALLTQGLRLSWCTFARRAWSLPLVKSGNAGGDATPALQPLCAGPNHEMALHIGVLRCALALTRQNTFRKTPRPRRPLPIPATFLRRGPAGGIP